MALASKDLEKESRVPFLDFDTPEFGIDLADFARVSYADRHQEKIAREGHPDRRTSLSQIEAKPLYGALETNFLTNPNTGPCLSPKWDLSAQAKSSPYSQFSFTAGEIHTEPGTGLGHGFDFLSRDSRIHIDAREAKGFQPFYKEALFPGQKALPYYAKLEDENPRNERQMKTALPNQECKLWPRMLEAICQTRLNTAPASTEDNKQKHFLAEAFASVFGSRISGRSLGHLASFLNESKESFTDLGENPVTRKGDIVVGFDINGKPADAAILFDDLTGKVVSQQGGRTRLMSLEDFACQSGLKQIQTYRFALSETPC